MRAPRSRELAPGPAGRPARRKAQGARQKIYVVLGPQLCYSINRQSSLLTKGNTMQKSYVREHSITMVIEIDLGEIGNLIEMIKPLAEGDETNYRAQGMYEKLKQVKREAVIEASREFKTMMESLED
jgi:hypothetical protein